MAETAAGAFIATIAQLSSNFGENYVCVGPWYPSSYIDTENTMNGKAGGDFGQNLFHKHLVFPWAVTRSRTWMQYCYCCNVLTMTCLLLCMLALNILNLGKQNAQIFQTDYENGVKASEGTKRHCLQHVIVTYCVWNILTGRCLLLRARNVPSRGFHNHGDHGATKPPVPCDFCVGFPISCLLTLSRHLFSIVS